MKKKLFIIILFLLLGLFIGNNLYNKVDVLDVFKEDNNFYILQAGIYGDKDTMQREMRDVSPKVYEIKDDKYYVYVGVTSNLDNAQKLKNIYEKDNIDIYIKKIKLKDDDFINSLKQFDILIENTNVDHEILTIEEVILSSFNKKILE